MTRLKWGFLHIYFFQVLQEVLLFLYFLRQIVVGDIVFGERIFLRFPQTKAISCGRRFEITSRLIDLPKSGIFRTFYGPCIFFVLSRANDINGVLKLEHSFRVCPKFLRFVTSKLLLNFDAFSVIARAWILVLFINSKKFRAPQSVRHKSMLTFVERSISTDV